MNWNIRIDKTSVNNLHIDFEPINYVTSCFFRSLKITLFPQYINELVENINFGVENTSFIFYNQMDWEDKAEFLNYFGREIQEDEIEICFYDGKSNYSALSRNDFEHIFYDYSEKLLEVYQLDTSLHETWKDEMTVALEKLKLKINNESPI